MNRKCVFNKRIERKRGKGRDRLINEKWEKGGQPSWSWFVGKSLGEEGE